MKSELIFQSSPWFILLCFLIGGGYAFLLYQKKSIFSKNLHLFLSIIRGLLVSLLCFLLVNPFLRSNKSVTEKPTVVLAIDNSSSLNINGKNRLDELKKQLDELKNQIKGDGTEIEIQTLSELPDNQNINTVSFNQKTSNLSDLLSNVKNNYEGRNLTDVILVSDGIANAGISPTYGKYNFNIHTIGIGDTTRKKDVKLTAVYANKIAYLGNKFPFQAEISSNGFQGKNTSVTLIQNGKVIDKQIVSFEKNEDLKSVTLYATATQKGIQRFEVEVVPLSGEHSTKNNRKDVYVDVVDGKEKILLVGLAPHPDIKALKAIIEKNDLYELTVKVLQSDNQAEIGTQPFDVLILHQLPDLYGSGSNLLGRLLAQGKPTFFVLGNQSNISSFNGMQQALSIGIQGGRADRVTAKFNTNFKLFNLDADKLNLLEQFPPLLAPFGEYKPSGGTEVILNQRVGSLVTAKPLLLANTTATRKTAVLAGEGLWQWRFEEFALTDKQEVVDEVIMKTIQLISVKDDKRKLRVYPISTEFSIDDKVIFETEAYNDIYERIYNQNIKLDVIDEKGTSKSYNYTISKENTRFEITGLPKGVYKFNASTQVLGKTEAVDGQFIVNDTDLESINTTADFNMLRTLANQNNGKFFVYNQLAGLKEFLSANKAPDKLTSIEEMNEFINLRWVFFILLLLASIEWAIRKYFGSY